ncbi:L-selenocysteine selenide-lyase (L-alanine-forming) / cysteine desulfurase [Psychromonas ingrahamii 37]|uniref:Probable cysteine desulfurase n=1 Tax=Psychromonas ingrahamii (strain DSM 17664 / CCUG 51855 / 37) TaxID=357804 RepID=A1SV03_PSYIN|nr:cysteine desulfurase [Psychromonas ingrahamii]ABM03318.1 L-selenocysteine selenide-lyase (L-alanine-forming) / cysteine desulfurase [Psychromonas ingrahamii 37]
MSLVDRPAEHGSLPLNKVDWPAIRRDFPLLAQKPYNKPLAYLDNAATTQKPNSVIDSIAHFYRFDNANVHRGIYQLSERATATFEAARDKIQCFLNARLREEIIFVRGATEAINLVAQSYARPRFKSGDEILISAIEHHSNIVPWQMVCKQTGAQLKVIPINDNGEIMLDSYQALLSEKTKIVAITHLSNALGSIAPVQRMITMAHARGIPVLLDGAQAAPHLRINLQALDCEFYTFSSHKIYGPTGVGVLYGKKSYLDAMEPYQGGGEMISRVSFESSDYNGLPYKFEAGTPNIAGVVGLAAALDYINTIGLDNICQREQQLLDYATKALEQTAGLRIIGQAKHKASIISFVLDSAHPHDISTILDQQGVAIRAGHHCAMPVMTRFNVPATARASFSFYNNESDIEQLVQSLRLVNKIFTIKNG